jgi:CheY-like chemotaxis protein
VRDLTVRILAGAGYSVLVAANGVEAVELFEANVHSVSIALLDVVMPIMTGHQAYDRLKAINPHLPVVFCSGHDPETSQVKLLLDQGARMVQKPFDPETLLRVIREVLDAQRAREALACAR